MTTYSSGIDGPWHRNEGLSYSSYLVLPRTVIQSMPHEWQERLIALVREAEEAFPVLAEEEYEVKTVTWMTVGDLDDEQRKALGITSSLDDFPDMPENPTEEQFDAHEKAYDEAAMEETFRDRDGKELDEGDRIAVPAKPKIPHYRRGRLQPHAA